MNWPLKFPALFATSNGRRGFFSIFLFIILLLLLWRCLRRCCKSFAFRFSHFVDAHKFFFFLLLLLGFSVFI